MTLETTNEFIADIIAKQNAMEINPANGIPAIEHLMMNDRVRDHLEIALSDARSLHLLLREGGVL